MTMLIKRKSIISGDTNSMVLPITGDQLDRWTGGELIQNVFPDLSVDQREFLMTGITPEEWTQTFGEEE